MTTSIGHRWKGSNVRSRVVLIARWLAQTPSRGKPRGATNLFFKHSCTLVYSSATVTAALSHYYVNDIRYRKHFRYKDFRWPWRRGPPLTIPNREVKPVCADGTATPSGRVGRRLFLKSLHLTMEGLFFCTISNKWHAHGAMESSKSGDFAKRYIIILTIFDHWINSV